jgi:hypothetical protein
MILEISNYHYFRTVTLRTLIVSVDTVVHGYQVTAIVTKTLGGWFVSCGMIFGSGETVLQVAGHFVLFCYHLEVSFGLVLLCHELLCVEN